MNTYRAGSSRLPALIAIFLFLACPGRGAEGASDYDIAIAGNNAAAADLYRQLSGSDGNLFFSPLSISSVLAMTYAGARGETAAQMARALHFDLEPDRLHDVFGELVSGWESETRQAGYRLAVANGLWAQAGYPFEGAFVGIIADRYRGQFSEVDFKSAAKRGEISASINAWVERKTDEKIKDLVVADMLTGSTKLILVNAIYFKGRWASPFNKKLTKDEQFFVTAGREIVTPMMNRRQRCAYMETETVQVLELPYAGKKLSMVVLLPKEKDGLPLIEGSLSRDMLDGYLSALQETDVFMTVPRFKIGSALQFNTALERMGMTDAFDVSKADFSGMTPDPVGLFISLVLQKSAIEIDEEGSEAAAASAVVMNLKAEAPPAGRSTEPIIFRADHPFVFLIRDRVSGGIMFMGRVVEP